jgi:hypothetical protein
MDHLAQVSLDFWVPMTAVDPGVPSQEVALPSNQSPWPCVPNWTAPEFRMLVKQKNYPTK